MANLAASGLRKGAALQQQNHARKKEDKRSQNQNPAGKNRVSGGLATKRSRRRASQGDSLGSARPPGKRAPRKSSKEQPAQLGLLVQVRRHMLKTVFRLP